jgi:hypothetical protein
MGDPQFQIRIVSEAHCIDVRTFRQSSADREK